jgi:hypothetical protein
VLKPNNDNANVDNEMARGCNIGVKNKLAVFRQRYMVAKSLETFRKVAYSQSM